jgi:hypothetical protein
MVTSAESGATNRKDAIQIANRRFMVTSGSLDYSTGRARRLERARTGRARRAVKDSRPIASQEGREGP